MSLTETNRRKQLLKDPVNAFIEQNPTIAQDQIHRLKALCHQRQNIKTEIKTIKNQQGFISKQIGEAKRQGNPLEPLKQRMQQYSTEAKTLNEQLQTVEEQILGFFQTAPAQHNTAQSDIRPSPARRYVDKQLKLDDISITPLAMDAADITWNAYVEEHPASSVYHRIEWRHLIHSTFGHTGLYLMARDRQNNIVGVLPLIRLRSWLFGDFMVSMPYFNYGGAIADHPDIEEKLLQVANQHAARQGVSHIEYRDDIERHGYPTRTDKVNMILTLPEDKETLWNSFSAKLRAQIRRPQRENTDILRGGKELLTDFYRVFAHNMRDLGTPVYGKRFFANILDTFPSRTKIIIVHLDSRPVAAAFLIGDGDTLEIPWASTIKRVNHLSMNMLLYWEVLKFAIEGKYKSFDFGRSSKGAGTYRFKKQWGAKPKTLIWHYWLKDKNDIPSLNPTNPKYALFIHVWRKLPVWLTRLMGPWIVRNLP